MNLVMGSMKSGKDFIELGKGSLHAYFPSGMQMFSDINKQYWYFEGKYKIMEDRSIILRGTGDIEKDFVILSKPRKNYIYERMIQSFDVKYQSNRGLVKIHVF